tara:strand:- start:3874 stop:4065 length:192 start_codon:yes stop_codon:yes gene_type:complete
MKLSHQAMGAIMLALQNSILEQSDIVPVLEDFNFDITDNEDLVVMNPPQAKTLEEVEEKFKDA